MKITLKRFLLSIASVGLLAIYGCGGGSDSDPSSSSKYINFAGSANGESVIDANNQYVKFLSNTRTMEVAGNESTDITVDSSNRIVKGNNVVIGDVKLVAGSDNSSIAGLVATNGKMLKVNPTASGTTSLVETDSTFAAPGTSPASTSESNGTPSNSTTTSGGGVAYYQGDYTGTINSSKITFQFNINNSGNIAGGIVDRSNADYPYGMPLEGQITSTGSFQIFVGDHLDFTNSITPFTVIGTINNSGTVSGRNGRGDIWNGSKK